MESLTVSRPDFRICEALAATKTMLTTDFINCKGQKNIRVSHRGEAKMHHPEEQQGLVEHELRDLGSEEPEGTYQFPSFSRLLIYEYG